MGGVGSEELGVGGWLLRCGRASNARPYYIIERAGVYFRGCRCSKGGGVRCGLRGKTQEPAFGTPGRAMLAPTMELQKGDKNFTHSLAVYGRGGALLHPGGLAAAQGFSGRAMLAPTMKLQNCDIFSRKPCLLLVGACMAGPPTVRGWNEGLQVRQGRGCFCVGLAIQCSPNS